MASWAVAGVPWWLLSRSIARTSISRPCVRPWLLAQSYVASAVLPEETPAMQALKLQPYPDAPVDTSLFEGEHELEAIASRQSQTAAHPDRILKRLVKNKQWADAIRVREELEKMGVSIRPSRAYGHVIRQIVKEGFSPERYDAFLYWCKLIPERDKVRYPHPIDYFAGSFLRPPPTGTYVDNPYLVPFTLVAIAKGYGPTTVPDVLTFLAKHGAPSACEDALQTFVQAHRGMKSLYEKEICAHYRLALDSLFQHGRVDAGLRLLNNALKDGIRWQESDHRRVFRRLRELDAQEGIDRLIQIAESQGISSQVSQYREVIHVHQNPSRPFVPLKPGQPSIESLVETLHELTAMKDPAQIHKLMSKENRDYPHWLLAQMLFHAQRNEHHLLLRAFRNNSFCVYTPPSDILDQVDGVGPREKWEHLFQDGSEQPPRRLLSKTRYNKIEPDQRHSALVWRSLVKLAGPDRRRVTQLYKELWRQVRASHVLSSREPGLAQVRPFDEAHFLPFAIFYARRFALGRVLRILRQMYRFDILPGLRMMNVLIGAYARRGNAADVNNMFDMLEKEADEEEEQLKAGGEQAREAARRQSRRGKIAPTAAEYRTAMKGFMLAGMPEAAHAVGVRMVMRLGEHHDESKRTHDLWEQIMMTLGASEDKIM